MKVTDQLPSIIPLNNIRAVRPTQTVKPTNKVDSVLENLPTTTSEKQIKPIDILSKDELSMLQQLFPEKQTGAQQADGYAKSRMHVHTAKLGSLVDIKK
ncbi:hypothetical protein JW960_01830 [candidate division KSB1 bacterium]|nr:hypothetical protein [candidate division KSB1 bacterium]